MTEITAPLLNVKQLASRLEVSRSTVYRLTSAGQIPACRVGRSLRFDFATVAQHMQQPPTRSKEAATP